jgi:hypothetical protein
MKKETSLNTQGAKKRHPIKKEATANTQEAKK